MVIKILLIVTILLISSFSIVPTSFAASEMTAGDVLTYCKANENPQTLDSAFDREHA